jgi:endonuclease/exonuclease/phosphatase family metal-dependent hydrolase
LRILTYNVHRCVGTDRRLDVGRVAAVIAAQKPDVVALQEVDVGRRRTGNVDQAHEIATRLGMTHHFNAALRVEEEEYGDAILTTLPERLVKAGPLPGHPRIPQLEPRGALWVAVDCDGAEVNIINTHLGLVPREQQIQARHLAGPEWIGAALADRPLIVLGDFNATGSTVVYRTLVGPLADARRHLVGKASTATFPSTLPVLRIDHVFIRGALRVEHLFAPQDSLARVASDHLPLVVDITLMPPP